MKIKILSKFSYQTFPEVEEMIEVDEAVIREIGISKCFDVEKQCIIDYTPPAAPTPSYEALAAAKINAKYTADEENAILRKTLMALYNELGGTPSPEFRKYYADAEACKAEARAETEVK